MFLVFDKSDEGRFDVAESAQSLATSWSGLKVARIEKVVTSMTRFTLATLFIEWDTMLDQESQYIQSFSKCKYTSSNFPKLTVRAFRKNGTRNRKANRKQGRFRMVAV